LAVIFGLGFTGARVARRLLQRGVPVSAAVRGVERFAEHALSGVELRELNLEDPDSMGLPQRAAVLVTIPPLPEPANSRLHEAILRIAPSRVVYISSTGVYGDRIEVDAGTPAAPNDPRGDARLAEEQWMAAGPWSCLTLRSAAIYGPGRGVHTAIREGRLPRGSGAGVVSRIHVDDLAAIAEAGLFSEIEGAWPVADDAPCSTDEIVDWCCEHLRWNSGDIPEIASHGAIRGRKADGRKIREILGVKLRYPSWKTGIPASIAEEREAEATPAAEQQSTQ